LHAACRALSGAARDPNGVARELLRFLASNVKPSLPPTQLKALHRDCLAATREATQEVKVRRGLRTLASTNNTVNASRRPMNVYAVVLFHRLCVALKTAGVPHPGIWGEDQARSSSEKEGLVLRLFRQCALLAGIPVPRKLDSIRREAHKIVPQHWDNIGVPHP
jgi:hypothetical protein